MPRLSIEARRRIVSLVSGRFTVPSIVQRLEEEKVVVSKRAVYDLVKKFRLKGVINAWLYSTRGYILRVAIFHAWTYSTHGHIPRVHGYIPRVGLHEMCMLHTIRKCGPRKHVTGFIGLHAWKSEVIIKRYCINNS